MFSRGIAAFLGGFTLLNLIGNFFAPGFDANVWWIDFSPMRRDSANLALLLGGIALLAHAIRAAKSRWARLAVFIPIASLTVIALDNAVRFYSVLHRHAIRTSVPVPLSGLIFAALLLIAWRVLLPARTRPRFARQKFIAAFAFASSPFRWHKFTFSATPIIAGMAT